MSLRTRPRPWLMLGAVVLAQASTTIVLTAPAFLIPLLHVQQGMSLAEASLLVAAASAGGIFTLVGWGWAVDHWGERRVLLIGLAATALFVALSTVVVGFVWIGLALLLSGATAVCTNSSSGRLIVGWFPPERRGLAMGIRQACQPIGVAVGALVVPTLADSGSIPLALGFGGVLVVVSLAVCAAVIVDPPRAAEPFPAESHPAEPSPVASGNPYRRSSSLVRIHSAAALLSVPQFTLSTYGLVWFISAFDWDPVSAGALVATSSLLGAGCRILIGVLSDRMRSRLRPLRWVALLCVAVLLALGLLGWLSWAVPAAVAYVVASCVSVADNGLTFTSVAELAGRRWSGRALGIHNTGQYAIYSVGVPAVGALIGAVGYPLAFVAVAAAPLVASALVPSPATEELPA